MKYYKKKKESIIYLESKKQRVEQKVKTIFEKLASKFFLMAKVIKSKIQKHYGP